MQDGPWGWGRSSQAAEIRTDDIDTARRRLLLILDNCTAVDAPKAVLLLVFPTIP